MSECPADRISAHAREVIDASIAKYPPEHNRSAVLAALREVQHDNGGYLTSELMDAVADYLDLAPIAIYEVASFYSMLETEPCGRHSISVCTNISCMLSGSGKIIEHIEQKLGVKIGESTADGRIFLKSEEECLAACCGAPMMMVDHVYYEKLTAEKVDQILADLK